MTNTAAAAVRTTTANTALNHCERWRLDTSVRGRNGSFDAGASAAGSWRRGVNAVDAREKRERDIVRAAALHGRIQHLPRRLDLSTLERRDAVVQQLFRLALLLGHRAAGALDVRARPRVIAIEKQRARPDVDGLCVVGREVLIEAGKKKALDLGVALGVAVGRGARLCVDGFVRSGSDICDRPPNVKRLWGRDDL